MGKSLDELDMMARADELYFKTQQKNMDIIGERETSMMMLGDQHIKMTEYPSTRQAEVLHRVLRE